MLNGVPACLRLMCVRVEWHVKLSSYDELLIKKLLSGQDGMRMLVSLSTLYGPSGNAILCGPISRPVSVTIAGNVGEKSAGSCAVAFCGNQCCRFSAPPYLQLAHFWMYQLLSVQPMGICHRFGFVMASQLIAC